MVSLSEADLQAYADGVLASEKADALLAYLSQRPDEARRVGFYFRLNDQLRFRFVDFRTLPSQRVRPGHRRVLILWATLACIALSSAAVWLTVELPGAALETAAVDALIAEQSHPAVSKPAPSAPDLCSAGFHPVGSWEKTLGPFSTANLITYRDANGAPLVVLSGPSSAFTRQLPWHALRIGAARLIEWTSATGIRTVVGTFAGTRGLMRAADALRANEEWR